MRRNWTDILITVGALLFVLGVLAVMLLSAPKTKLQVTEPSLQEVDVPDTLGTQFPR